jgi:hypothetical protein
VPEELKNQDTCIFNGNDKQITGKENFKTAKKSKYIKLFNIVLSKFIISLIFFNSIHFSIT